MRYRLQEIEAFLTVVETGSISAAAVRLDLAKSVISKRVSGLEDCLGVALLQRSTRRAVPTASGLEFFERSKAVVQQLNELAESVGGRDRGLAGTVRLALPMSFGHLRVVPALLPLLQENRDLTVQMDLDDRRVDLVQGGYDLAIRIGVLPDSTLVARRLAYSRRVLCCSPAYLARSDPPRTLADLAEHDCIGYGLAASSQIWQFQPAGASPDAPAGERVATPVRARVIANNGEAMVQAVLGGLGLSVLPTFLVGGLVRSGALVELDLGGMTPTWDPVNAIYAQSRNLSAKVRAIIDVLAQAWAGDVPPWDRH